MILYRQTRVLLRVAGSVLPMAFVPALLSAVLCGLLERVVPGSSDVRLHRASEHGGDERGDSTWAAAPGPSKAGNLGATCKRIVVASGCDQGSVWSALGVMPVSLLPPPPGGVLVHDDT